MTLSDHVIFAAAWAGVGAFGAFVFTLLWCVSRWDWSVSERRRLETRVSDQSREIGSLDAELCVAEVARASLAADLAESRGAVEFLAGRLGREPAAVASAEKRGRLFAEGGEPEWN